MKYIKKQNNIIFGMANLSDSRHELKKIKKIYAKAPKKHDYPIRDRSSSDYDSYLSSDSEWDVRRQPN